MTRREAEVLDALADRLTNAEIAAQLSLSERTVESHVASLLRKLGAANRLELSRIARAGQRAVSDPNHRVLAPAAEQQAFVGRERELGRLRAQWELTATGRTSFTVIAGEAGIGKSRLAAELAAEVLAGGGNVLSGSCLEGSLVPYAPFVQAVREDASRLDLDEVTRRIGPNDVWARLVPGLWPDQPMQPPREVFDAMVAQGEVFDALHGYLRRAAERRPTLVVLDDVHWATATTRGALLHIARQQHAEPLHIVVTTRDGPPDFDDSLGQFLADLATSTAVERLDLAGLLEGDVAMLLGHHVDIDVAAVATETGGNPLLVLEVLNGAGRAGGSLEGLLSRRYLRLDSEALYVLEVASVLGTEFDVEILSEAADRPLSDIYSCLDESIRAGLVAPTRRPGRFAFVHGLFRRARYDAVPAPRRSRMHARAVTVLAARLPDDVLPAEIARHAVAATSALDAREALRYIDDAARIAEQSMSLAEASELYRSALTCAGQLEPADPDLELDLMIRLGGSLRAAATSEYLDVLSDAAERARELHDAEALADVGLALVKYSAGRDPGSPDYLLLADITRDALRELGDAQTPARARTLAAAAEDLSYTDADAAHSMAEEALAIARRLGDPITLGHVLLGYRVAGRVPGNDAARHPVSDELIAIGERFGQPTFAMLGYIARAWNHREEGDLAAAGTALDAGVAASGGAPLPPPFDAAVMAMRMGQRMLRGDLEGAEEYFPRMWALASPGFDPLNWAGPGLLVLAHARGKLPDLAPMLEMAGQQAGIGAPYEATRALAIALTGNVADAGAIVNRLVADDLAAVPRNFTYLACLVILAEATGILGDFEAARLLLPELEPYSGRIAELPQTPVGPIDLALADLALTLGDISSAEAFAQRAVEASRRRGTPIYLGRELLRLATAKQRLGRPADETESLVAEALALAETTGASVISAEAQRLGLA